jgi:hypothetical protein
MVTDNKFANDIEFQEHLQDIFQKTIDAHTRYQKPACYNAIFIQPFAFDMRLETQAKSNPLASEPVIYLMRNLYTEQYNKVFPNVSVEGIFGQQIKLVNGVEFTTEVSSWGDTRETKSNNRGIRFNAAIRSYLYRSAISLSILPLEDLTITLANGSDLTFPWMASYTSGLADVSKCAAIPKSNLGATTQSKHDSRARMEIHLHDPPVLLEQDHLYAGRPDRVVIVPSNSPYYLSCFTQTVKGEAAGVSRVLVMKVSSFSPPGANDTDAWTKFLDSAEKCLSSNFDMILVDVIQNTGGYVCLGLRLIELLVEDYENDHTKVQMNYDLPHSKLMDRYIELVNSPEPYPYPEDVEQILDRNTQQPFPDGRAYYYPGRNVTQGGVINWRTNYFSLDCREVTIHPNIIKSL